MTTYFEPKASSEWEEERNERIDSNEAESAEDEQAGDDFKCELCDFTSTLKGGFNIHMGRKHKLIRSSMVGTLVVNWMS